MSDPKPLVEFLAVLIFKERDPQRVTEAPLSIRATHPEIAYQLALKRGAEEPYSLQFLGLSHLQVAAEEVHGISRSAQGDAQALVSPKADLAAFHDPRWTHVECTAAEIEEALREPPMMVELDGLDDIPWSTLGHAYGSAQDVPLQLKRLASNDKKHQEDALWKLTAAIFHQGDIYDSSVAAIPFLVTIATTATVPNRVDLCETLADVAECATTHQIPIPKLPSWDIRSCSFSSDQYIATQTNISTWVSIHSLSILSN